MKSERLCKDRITHRETVNLNFIIIRKIWKRKRPSSVRECLYQQNCNRVLNSGKLSSIDRASIVSHVNLIVRTSGQSSQLILILFISDNWILELITSVLLGNETSNEKLQNTTSSQQNPSKPPRSITAMNLTRIQRHGKGVGAAKMVVPFEIVPVRLSKSNSSKPNVKFPAANFFPSGEDFKHPAIV